MKNKLLTALLSASLIMQAPPARASGPACGVGIVIIVGGGYIIWKLGRFCKKKYPNGIIRNTNAPPDLVAQTEYAGAWSFDPWETCDEDSGAATTFTIEATIGSNVTTRVTASPSFQSLNEFREQAASHGVSLTPGNQSAFYARDGVPVKASESPLRFDAASRTVTVGNGEKTVLIEQSSNLRDWLPLGTVKVPEGTRLRIEDTTSAGQQFYRLTLR